MNAVTIEADGRILRGIAVPWGVETIVQSPTRRGERIIHRERFDAESITGIGALFGRPLLVGHDETRPIGRVQRSESTTRGLEIEAELVGTDEELEGLRRRLAAGLLAHLSVGFVADRRADVWHRPPDGRLPLVVRRNTELREVSLVQWPAYEPAIVTGVTLRTSIGERRHAKSQAAIVEYQRFVAKTSQRAQLRAESA